MAARLDNPDDRDRSLELDVMREIEQIVSWRPPRPAPDLKNPGSQEDEDDGVTIDATPP
jgi:hypothetical protein